MSIKEFLLAEASTFDYISSQTTKDASSNDTWTFDSGSQTISIKANNLTTGRVLAYRKSARPTIYHMFMSVNGKTSRSIKTIQKPLNAVATIANIIATETESNTQSKHILFRLPSSSGITQTVSSICVRYLKKHGVQFELDQVIGSPDGKYDYIVLSRSSHMFDVEAHFKIKVAADATPEEVAVQVSAVVEPQMKKFVPAQIDVSTIAGNTEVPEKVQDYLSTSKTIQQLEREGKSFTTHVGNRNEIQTQDAIHKQKIIADIPKIKTSLRMSGISIDDRAEDIYAEIVHEVNELDLTIQDMIDGKVQPLIKLMDRLAKKHQFDFHSAMIALFRISVLEGMKIAHEQAYLKLGTTVPAEHKATIMHYCGMGFKTINNFLLNGSGGNKGQNLVAKMDKAFEESAAYVTKDVLLFRSMAMRDYLALEIAEGKLFHFRTYVSTTTSPIKGMSFCGPGMSAMATYRYTDLMDTDPIDRDLTTTMTIRDAYKIPVVVPGKFAAQFPQECEVIMPRGTTVRINRLAASPNRKGIIQNVHFDTSVVPSSEIAVNETVYDGDAFISTGKLKAIRVGFGTFVNESKGIDELDQVKTWLLAGQAEASKVPEMGVADRMDYEELKSKFCSQLI
ncbi:hypothetical protein AHP1_2381 [Aeromonas phage Ahp1_CNU-2021]|nr:hypothetical protein AHP1_2381 [Aeromonas phage Ahp1_CNU-2021]